MVIGPDGNRRVLDHSLVPLKNVVLRDLVVERRGKKDRVGAFVGCVPGQFPGSMRLRIPDTGNDDGVSRGLEDRSMDQSPLIPIQVEEFSSGPRGREATDSGVI
jgi:hypothetical protein